ERVLEITASNGFLKNFGQRSFRQADTIDAIPGEIIDFPNFRLTSDTGVGDGDPEIDCLLGSEFLVVPFLLDADGPVRLDGHPRIFIADLERLQFRLLFELEDDPALGLAVRFRKLDPLRRADGPRDAPLVPPDDVFRPVQLVVDVVRRRDEVELQEYFGRPFGRHARRAEIVSVDGEFVFGAGRRVAGEQEFARLRHYDDEAALFVETVGDAISVRVRRPDGAQIGESRPLGSVRPPHRKAVGPFVEDGRVVVLVDDVDQHVRVDAVDPLGVRGLYVQLVRLAVFAVEEPGGFEEGARRVVVDREGAVIVAADDREADRSAGAGAVDADRPHSYVGAGRQVFQYVGHNVLTVRIM
ncbi:unnamed protein product, partial [Nesidiocoris tenuis]